MFATKLTVITPVLAVVIASIEPALAGPTPVPGPIIGAGLPVLAVLAGGYWVVRKVRQRR
jgi:hypothetical protein